MKALFKIIVAGTWAVFMLSSGIVQQSNPWVAPKEADALVNPMKNNFEATAEGKKLYVQYCTVCHGEKGKGDGPAAISLPIKPANHTSPKVQSQTDGAIYWKITNGRATMASYKASLKDEQRWQLVNYIRTLDKTTLAKKS